MLNVKYEIAASPFDPKIEISFLATDNSAIAGTSASFSGKLTLCDDLVRRTKLERAATAADGLLGVNCRPNFLISPVKRQVLDAVSQSLDIYFHSPMVLIVISANMGVFSLLGCACGLLAKKTLGGAIGGPQGAVIGLGIGTLRGAYRAYHWNQRRNELQALTRVLILSSQYDSATIDSTRFTLSMIDLEPVCKEAGGAAHLAFAELKRHVANHEPRILTAIEHIKHQGILGDFLLN